MSVPNLKHVVQAVRDSRIWNFTTAEASPRPPDRLAGLARVG